MHTARQLDDSLFELEIDGIRAERAMLVPDCQPNDRLGVIVDRPFGAIGASLLLQLAITAFYDARPARRDSPLYPDVYLFHVGGRHGDHTQFDVFPPRKEVDVADEAALILEAINDRAITRPAVVDGPAEAATHHWKEAALAHDRIVSTFAYAPSGQVADHDVSIVGRSPRVTANTRNTFHPPDRTYADQASARARMGPAAGVPNREEMLPEVDRRDEVSVAVREALAKQREVISTNGRPRETSAGEHLECAVDVAPPRCT